MVPHEDAPVAVVGGGPAGLMAAETLAAAGIAVTVYDRMPTVGRKMLIAGRGGLNLTHSEPLAAFLGRYHPPHAGLRAAIEAYPPEALRAWCDGLGEPTFIGSSGRVFPTSFKASPLLRAWLARLDRLGVAIRPRHRLVGWEAGGLTFETPEGRSAVRPRAILLALGGASWPRLGSDGAWTELVRAEGIAVAPLTAANVGFTVAWSAHFAERFAGAPLKRAGFAVDGVGLKGEAVITADGIEGGAIYALGRAIRGRIEAEGAAALSLDLRPDLDAGALARRLSASRLGASMATRLRKAAALSPVAAGLLREAHGPGLPRDPVPLAEAIKACGLLLGAARPIARAISSAGGLRFDALDARFMLRDRPGTFAAGEMLDWEAPTGGYLLQGAFASGRAAALGLIAWLGERPA